VKKISWATVVMGASALTAGAFGYGALSQTVSDNSARVERLAVEHKRMMEILIKVDRNQALLTQRLEEHLRRTGDE